jgi:hypothetical protein
MTVAELILELQFQPQDMTVSIVDGDKKKFQEFTDFDITLCQPELNDNYIAITFTRSKWTSSSIVTQKPLLVTLPSIIDKRLMITTLLPPEEEFDGQFRGQEYERNKAGIRRKKFWTIAG